MKRYMLFLFLVLLGFSHLALATTDLLVIYNKESKLPTGMKIGVWGNNPKIINTIATGIQKPEQAGIPIRSLGRYQGTRIDLAQPVDLSPCLGQRDVFLELYLRADISDITAPVIPPTFRKLWLTFFTNKGSAVVLFSAQEFFPLDKVNDGWFRVALPLSAMTPQLPEGSMLQRIIMSTDASAAFTLGRLAFVRDSEALSADIVFFPALPATGELVFFSSSAQSGLTPCTVSWTFNSLAIKAIDATGDRALTVFTNPGNYLVTCTIQDRYGVKAPLTITKEIKVIRPRL